MGCPRLRHIQQRVVFHTVLQPLDQLVHNVLRRQQRSGALHRRRADPCDAAPHEGPHAYGRAEDDRDRQQQRATQNCNRCPLTESRPIRDKPETSSTNLAIAHETSAPHWIWSSQGCIRLALLWSREPYAPVYKVPFEWPKLTVQPYCWRYLGRRYSLNFLENSFHLLQQRLPGHAGGLMHPDIRSKLA